jgi:predicted phage terminase large subunit-like protein
MQDELLIEQRRRDFHRFLLATFPDFIDGWIYVDLCERLKKFMLDIRFAKSPRLIVCLPPRSGKSQTITVRFALYCLLNNPVWEVLVASYSQSLVNRFSRFTRSLLESHSYIKTLWPHIKLAQDHGAVEEWAVSNSKERNYQLGGTYRAVGKGGSITGAGANCFVAFTKITIHEGCSIRNPLTISNMYTRNHICSHTKKFIQDIKPGDLVLSFNHILGKREYRHVLATTYTYKATVCVQFFIGSRREYTTKILALKKKRQWITKKSYKTYPILKSLFCTEDHQFYVSGKGYVEAKNLLKKDMCLCMNEKSNVFQDIYVHGVLPTGHQEIVYDIQVEQNHNFFAEDILVHNCLILDDTLKDFEEADSANARAALWDWYSSTARTRLTPGGGILVVQTRWHPDDLVGRVLHEEKHTTGSDKWDLVEYQALAEKDEEHRKTGESFLPSRWSAEELLRIKSSIAPRWWEALYQQRPQAPGGNLIKEKMFHRYLSSPKSEEFDKLIQVWDLRFSKSQAKTSSFVCGWIMGRIKGKFYVLDESRDRWSYAESRTELLKLTEKWPKAITKVIENKANGAAIESDLEGTVPGIILYNPRGDKFQRVERVLPLLLAGNVYFPDDSVVTWAKEAMHELTMFPRGADDDRVDCFSMGLAYLLEEEQQFQTVIML